MLSVFITIAVVSNASGDNTNPALPDPEQIRKDYLDVAANSPAIPDFVMVAFVAAEDRAFFDKPLLNSTITRQITQWYPQPQAEQLQRLAYTVALGQVLSHEEILTLYVNGIYLGQTCFGVSGAAEVYFQKSVDALSLEEAAYLAALPKAPMLFHPLRDYDRAVERRNFVLAEMRDAGFISGPDAEHAMQSVLMVNEPLGTCPPEE